MSRAIIAAAERGRAGLAFAAAATLLFLAAPRVAAAQAVAVPSACDRACLYGVLDHYLEALAARDAGRVRWSALPRTTENNVELRPGDGLWGTLTRLDPDYQLRMADPLTGQVAVFGALWEADTKAPYALRLRVVDRTVAEAELLVVRPQDAGIPFVTADMKPRAAMSGALPPAQRTPRAQMVAAANGYFETLQLNDGTLHVQFTDDCDRRENGLVTTRNPAATLDPLWKLGCADQFRMGAYRYDDRLRERRFPLVDEEQGLVLAGGFIDHEGRLAEFRLTDGSVRQSIFRRPHSFVLLEAFRIRAGSISAVEAVFLTVPYNMPSPWSR